MLPRKRPPAATEPDAEWQTLALPPPAAKTKTESTPPPRVAPKVEAKKVEAKKIEAKKPEAKKAAKRELPKQPPARIPIRAPMTSDATIEVKEVDTERRNAENIGAMLNEVLSELDVPSKAKPLEEDPDGELVTKLRSAVELEKSIATLSFVSEDDAEKSIATLKRVTTPQKKKSEAAYVRPAIRNASEPLPPSEREPDSEPGARIVGKDSGARKPAASEVWIFGEGGAEPKSEEVQFASAEFPHFETTHRMPAAAVPASVKQVIASADSVSQLPFAQTQAVQVRPETAPLPFTPPMSAPPPPMPAPAPMAAPVAMPRAAVQTAVVRRRRPIVPWTIAAVAIALSGLILIDPSTRAQLFGHAKSLTGRSTAPEPTTPPAANTAEAAQPPPEVVNVSWQPSARNPSWAADTTPAPTPPAAVTAAATATATTAANTTPTTTATATNTPTTTTTVAATATATTKQRAVAQSGSRPPTPRPRPAAKPKAPGAPNSAEDDEAAAAAAALAKAQLEDSLDK